MSKKSLITWGGSLLLALMLSSPSLADRWIHIATGVKGVELYLDSETIERVGPNQYLVWTKEVYPNGRSTRERFSIWSHRKYQRIDVPSYRVQDIVPDTIYEELFRHIFGSSGSSGGGASSSSVGDSAISRVALAASSRKLTASDLSGMNGRQLTLARNEIYARRGRSFSDPDLRSYFRTQPWYTERSSYRDSDLSALEKENAQFILNFQQNRGLTW